MMRNSSVLSFSFSPLFLRPRPAQGSSLPSLECFSIPAELDVRCLENQARSFSLSLSISLSLSHTQTRIQPGSSFALAVLIFCFLSVFPPFAPAAVILPTLLRSQIMASVFISVPQVSRVKPRSLDCPSASLRVSSRSLILLQRLVPVAV